MAQSQSVALARITPRRMPVAAGEAPRMPLSRRQKAAVIVRLLLAEGAPLPLSALPEALQAELAEQMGEMRLVDRSTVEQVASEFLSELEEVGLTFPAGLDGALSLMDGHISQATASRLRRQVGIRPDADPWDRIAALAPEQVAPLLDAESPEVAAILLSKLPVAKSARLLSQLPGERARRVAFAMSRTGNVDPRTVRRIGLSLLMQLDSQPPRAFDTPPQARVGAILNVAPEITREDVLRGLAEEDAGFAEEVRKAIFTYAHLPQRLSARDVPKLLRVVDQPTLITALSAAQGNPEREAATAFILENISPRMAQQLREEMAKRGKIPAKEGEAAMTLLIEELRGLEAAGELRLRQPEEEE